MYIFKYAWKSIVRNKGRNILIGIIVLVISCACCIALAIRSSANTLIKSYEDKYDVEASISVDRSSMMSNFDPSSDSNDDLVKSFDSIGDLTIDEIEDYADSDYVTSYYYTYSVGLDGSNIDPASSTTTSTDSSSSTDTSSNSNQMPGGMNQGAMSMGSDTDFKVVGYSSVDAMTEFIEGSYTITDGEVSTDDNTCVINSELATLNDISVGDTIKLVDPNDDDNVVKLTVTGIFEESSDSESQMSMFSNSVNNIITTASTVEAIAGTDDDLDTSITPTFILTSADDVDAFQSELYEKGMNEDLSVTTNLDQVDSATSTISNVSSFALTFLIVVLVIGSIVLLVLNAINIRERKYEIGVLRTVGMKKSKLALQFMMELMIVSVFALIIGAAIGASISVPVSNQLLASEISSSESQVSDISKNFGQGNESDSGSGSSDSSSKMDFSKVSGVNTVQAYDSIDAAVNIKVLAELLGIGLALTMISSLAAMISIQKFSPLTILKERS